jgi:hypothetical protein
MNSNELGLSEILVGWGKKKKKGEGEEENEKI